jgi:hypothetical protein
MLCKHITFIGDMRIVYKIFSRNTSWKTILEIYVVEMESKVDEWIYLAQDK